MKKLTLVFCLLLMALWPRAVVGGEMPAADVTFDASALEDAVEDLDALTDGVFSLSEALERALRGELVFEPEAFLAAAGDLFLGEIKDFAALFAQLLLLGVLAAVFRVFTDSFSDGGAARVGEYVIFLAFLLPAVKCLGIGFDLAKETVGAAADLLFVLLPPVLGSFAFSGGATAAAVVQPTVLMAASVFLELLDHFFMPLLLLLAIIAVAARLAPGYSFRRLFELVRSVVLASLALMMTVFTGLLGLGSFAAGTIDGLTAKTMKAAAGSFIPVVGGYLAEAFDAVVGAGVLIRSVVGLFGIVAIAAVLVVPALKIVAMALLFKIAAALLEPFCGEGYVAALADFGTVMTLVFAVVAVAALLFFFLIFTVLGVTSVTLMYR